MRKLFASTLAVAALALFAIPAQAQAQATASATASVDVYAALTLTNNSGLDFGVVTPGSGTKTIDAQTGATAGSFTATGEPGATVTVTSTPPATLDDGAGNTISVTATELSYNTANDQGNSTTISSGGAVTLAGLSATNPGDGYFWIGGTIDVTTVPTGTYTGTWTLEVAY